MPTTQRWATTMSTSRCGSSTKASSTSGWTTISPPETPCSRASATIRRFHSFRAVRRGRREQHHVDVRCQHLLVCVEADEVMVRIDLHLAGYGRVLRLADLAERLFQVVFEDISHGHQ